MNPYHYYFNTNFIPQHQYWYSRNQQLYNFYQTQPHGYATRPNLTFNQQLHNKTPNQPEIVKIEDESDHHPKALQQHKIVSRKQHNTNSQKKKRNTAIQYKKRQGYPSKMTRYKVKYFDPCSCPPITSHGYNLVLNTNMQVSRANLLSLIPQEHVNELLYPQIDSNPFICYRFRRIKKRFKKYVKTTKTESHQNSEDNESNEQQSQSISRSQESSRSDFPNRKINKNSEKGMKKMKPLKKQEKDSSKSCD